MGDSWFPLLCPFFVIFFMRVWDVSPKVLCQNHLLGEHRELHAVWSVITKDKKGYSLHPETMRWKGKLLALYNRHDQLVREMANRGYSHKSPLDKRNATGSPIQDAYVNTIPEQRQILKDKKCSCKI